MTDANLPERPDGEIDLVAEPIRYPRSPLIALILVALVPTAGLYALQRWADTEADQYEATRDAVVALEGNGPEPGFFDPDLSGGLDLDNDGVRDDEVPDDTVAEADESADDEADATSTGVDELGRDETTGLLDFRRTPGLIADVASARRLAAEVEPVFAFLDDRSCGAVSVDGVPVLFRNPEAAVIPASNQKLLVASVALDVLGADYRYTTSVASPESVDGVVDGDVYLIGGGDPLLTSSDYPIEDDALPAINTTPLDVLADAVVRAGITRIRGTVIGDGTRYDDEFFIDEWAEGIAGVEAGPYDALLANDGRVRGRNSRDDDPNAAAAREFVRLLSDRGVRVDNGFGSGTASTLAPVIGTVESAPLSDVIAEMLLTSDNNTAEMMVKELGFVGRGEGTRAAGLDVMNTALAEAGVPMEGVALRDGSGLSVNNRVTCPAVLAILQRGADGPVRAGLPVAARTGTLADEFVGSPMEGRLRAKTGTLANEPFDADPPAVKALAGYVTTTDDRVIEFVMIANSPDISVENRYQPLWSALGERFDTFPSGPDAESLGPRTQR